MTYFDGARIAVTGASGGIGRSICADLAGRGARVIALDLAPALAGGADEAPAGSAAAVEFAHCDVSDPESVRDAVDGVADRMGGIDGLVAAAGVVEDDIAAEDMDIAEFDRVLSVNLRGVFLSCQAAARHMLGAGAGRIVAISSMSGNHVVNHPQRQCAYNASKAGVSALVRSLAVEWGPRGVRVNALAPGYVGTPLLDAKTAMHGQWKDGTIAGRFAEPDEIAKATAWLLGDDAAFCQGTELLIDGGYSLR